MAGARGVGGGGGGGGGALGPTKGGATFIGATSLAMSTAGGVAEISNSERVVASSFTSCNFARAFRCNVGSVAEGSTPLGGFMEGRNSLGLLPAEPRPADRLTGRDPAL